jgi:hypothetical protein
MRKLSIFMKQPVTIDLISWLWHHFLAIPTQIFRHNRSGMKYWQIFEQRASVATVFRGKVLGRPSG